MNAQPDLFWSKILHRTRHNYDSWFENAYWDDLCNQVYEHNGKDNTDIDPIRCCEFACADPIDLDA